MTTSFAATVVMFGAITPHAHLTHISKVPFSELNKMQYLKIKICEHALLHGIIYSVF